MRKEPPFFCIDCTWGHQTTEPALHASFRGIGWTTENSPMVWKIQTQAIPAQPHDPCPLSLAMSNAIVKEAFQMYLYKLTNIQGKGATSNPPGPHAIPFPPSLVLV